MPRLNLSKTHTDGFRPDTTNNGLSINGFHPLTSGAFFLDERRETEPEKPPTSGVIKGRMPKLYNHELYNNYTEKLSSIKEKYTSIQKQLHSNDKNLDAKSLRELIKETEDIFARSYSIKYFGINRNQIGIMSRRVPIKLADRNFLSSSQIRQRKSNPNEQPQKFSPNQPSGTKSSTNFRPSTRGMISASRLRGLNQRSYTAERFNRAVTLEDQVTSDDNIGEIVKTEEAAAGKEDVFPSPNKNDAEVERLMPTSEAEKQKPQEYFPRPEDYNVYVVNQYFIPKQLQTVRKVKKETTSAERVSELIDLQLNSYLRKVPTNSKVPSNYDRLARGTTKIKRAMLRAPASSLRCGTEPSQDQLIEADKFKTHELRKLLADRENLSYAKLLNSFGEPGLINKMQSVTIFDQLGKPRRLRNQSQGESQIHNSTSSLLVDENSNLRVSKDHSLFNSYAKIAKRYKSVQDPS